MSSGSDTGSFSVILHDLDINTNYYLRAFAYNAADTAYGAELILNILAIAPSVQTDSLVEVGSDSIVLYAQITDDGNNPILARGLSYNTSGSPDFSDVVLFSAQTSDAFNIGAGGLLAGNTYYFRPFAYNSVDTSYGGEVSLILSADCDLILDSVVAVNANLGVYRAYFDTLVGTSWELEYKGINDAVWRSKTISRATQGNQKFNITPSFGMDVLVRIVYQDVGTVTGCETTVQVPCKQQNFNIITQIEAFCEGASVLLRAGYSGGYRTPAFLWSNGATTKRTYVNQGDKLVVTVTDLAGCSVTDSIRVPILNTVGAPAAFNLSRDNATTFTGSWTASSLPIGASLIGYRMAYRQANVGASWITTSLSSNTTATVDFTGSGNVSANYEFTAFARINDNGSVYNTEYACKDRKFYNGSGGKSDGQSLDENGNTIISIYPNPTNGKVYVQAELGAKIQLFDLQGKLLSEKEALSNETAFDLSAYAKGVYMMKVTTDERVVSEQVMKN